MSLEVSTSAASWASPLPSWLPNARPPIWPSIAIIGPACARTSSGSPSTQAVATRWATGSHSRCHVGRLASTHSVADQPLASVAPAGKSVAGVEPQLGELHRVARRRRAGCAVNDDVVAASCWCAICAARS